MDVETWNVMMHSSSPPQPLTITDSEF